MQVDTQTCHILKNQLSIQNLQQYPTFAIYATFQILPANVLLAINSQQNSQLGNVGAMN